MPAPDSKVSILRVTDEMVTLIVPRGMVEALEDGRWRIEFPGAISSKSPDLLKIREAANTFISSETWADGSDIPANLRRVAHLLGVQCQEAGSDRNLQDPITYLTVVNHLRAEPHGRFNEIVEARNTSKDSFLAFFNFLIEKGLLDLAEARDILIRSNLNPTRSNFLAAKLVTPKA
jgi:hypothetical protein